MPRYKRSYEGNTFFFTVVTHKRRPFLCDEQSRLFLKEVINEVRVNHPFKIDAWVLLPDHLHCIWTLPAGDADYSTRWGLIKAGFSKKMNNRLGGARADKGPSRAMHREGAYWQRRFWEHSIKDQCDYNSHMDYIHINPVKHGLVTSPAEWEYSSFHRLVNEGVYGPDWGLAGDMVTMDVGRE